MQTYRGLQKDIERTKQGKPDWHFRIGVYGGLVVVVLLLILLVKILINI